MQNEKLITILGATGPQGRSVIDHLLKLNSSSELKGGKYKIRGVCRDIHKHVAEELKTKGVDVIECDWSSKEDVVKCTKNSYLVFGATQHFQQLIMETPELEVTWGKNMVDACLENKVSYFIWSSMENADEVSKGEYHLPFMTNKNRVEQYARQFSSRLKSIFVYVGGYFENYFNFLKVDKQSGSRLQGVLYAPIITPFPQFDVYDLGKIVVPIIQKPEPLVGKRVLAAFQNIGMKEVADIFSKVLEIPVRFELQDHEHFAQQRGKELADFYAYVETFGIMRHQEQELIRTLSHFKEQGFKDLASWIELNKDHWLHGEVPSSG